MALFASFPDVSGRFEGTMPDDRRAWVELRLLDAEAELIGLVPAVAPGPSSVSELVASRVRRLLCDKVLELYRNPDGAVSTTTTMGPMSEARSLPGARGESVSWPRFSDAELQSLDPGRKGRVRSVPLRSSWQ